MKILGELWINDVTRTLSRAKKNGREVTDTELLGMKHFAERYGVTLEVEAIIEKHID
jgi:hypothetical protein